MKPVLIIEDDVDIQDCLITIFEMENYPVLTAVNGLEALKLLKAAVVLPGLIFVDSMMPVMNGQKFITELQTSAEYSNFKNIPIVVLSAGMTEIVGKIAGRVDKPATIDALMSYAQLYCR